MPKYLTETFKNEIREKAISCFPEETGGIFIEADGYVFLKNCDNISSKPETHYLISPEDIQESEKLGKIVGYWHSHPKADNVNFHLGDIAIAEKEKINSVIYVNSIDQFSEYEPIGYEIPYEGRPFYVKVLDCLTLVIDFYQREFNLKIPYIDDPILDYDIQKWVYLPENKVTKTTVRNYLIRNDFVEVEDLKFGDVLVMQPLKTKFPCHFGIYTTNGQFLHQPISSLSKVVGYTDKWKNRTKYIFRHKKLM